jgi:hypothetical protein
MLILLFYIRLYPPSDLFPEYFLIKTVYAYTVPSTPYVTQKTRSLFLKYVHPFVHIPLPHTLNVTLTCYISLNATNFSHSLTTICSSLARSVNPLKKKKKLKVLSIEDIPLCFNTHNKTTILYNYWYFVTAGYGGHILILPLTYYVGLKMV